MSTGRRFTFHRLQLVPGNPTSYVYEGETEQMRKQTVTTQVLTGGVLVPQTHDFYFSRFGRITNYAALGIGWNTTNAYAFNDANGDNLRVFDVWLNMDRAKTAQDVIDAQKKIMGMPWVNTLGADDRGNSFYTDLLGHAAPDVRADHRHGLHQRGPVPAATALGQPSVHPRRLQGEVLPQVRRRLGDAGHLRRAPADLPTSRTARTCRTPTTRTGSRTSRPSSRASRT